MRNTLKLRIHGSVITIFDLRGREIGSDIGYVLLRRGVGLLNFDKSHANMWLSSTILLNGKEM